MEKSLVQKSHVVDLLIFICLAILGSLLIVFGALVQIPCIPVPFTLQTFAVFLLALTQAPKQAFASVICYLLYATIGLPVLPGGVSNPLWILGPCGGYLLAFPFGAYLSAWLAQKIPGLLATSFGLIVIYLLGFIWLLPFVDVKIAFTKGVILFIPSDLLKNMSAVFIAQLWKKI
ncbi:MAG: biotin transporter BioY [Chlamydiales bacterium]|nr:biotin transporter BioY [Chlamydiales bacterium]